MHRPRANKLLIVLLALLALILGVLATLQYRWIDRVSEAERQQMRANLDFATRAFSEDLRKTLEPIVSSFETERDLVMVHSDLVIAVYRVGRDEEGWFVDDGQEYVPWPPSLEPVHQRLERVVRIDQDPPPPMPGPFLGEIPALLLVQRRRAPAMAGPALFGGGLPRIDLVQLDGNAIAKEVLPRLAQRHFSREYDVAVMSGTRALYRSNPAWPDATTKPDAELEMHPIQRRGAGPPGRPIAGAGRETERLESRDAWRLLVRRHDGGVEGIVSAARNRNLAVSFGIMLILGAAVMTLAALLRRAERLREQQLEFVAAISHELNTPVAAIRSAGENLRDGIIGEREKVIRYGESIVREATRLGELVGQVLELAGMQRRARKHEPVDVAAMIEDAAAQCEWLVHGKPIELEAKIEEGLPPVLGDRALLTRAVQNLIANAIRHGGSGGWIGVRATHARGQVCITIEDRGPGIDAGEAAHLFEPFYRGRHSAAVPGAGLGLAIVRQIAVAHGGTVEMEKRRGGAAFTMQLPAGAAHD